MTQKNRLIALALGACALVPSWGQTADEEPSLVFKSNIYDSGAESHFTFVLGSTEDIYIDVDCGFGKTEYEVGAAIFDEDTQAVAGTIIDCVVGPEGLVKVYGDVSKIDYLFAEGVYMEWIDLSKCTSLSVLNLEHNELTGLDLTPFNELQALYISDNPFTETPLKIGYKPNLLILEMMIVGNIDPSFTLKDYPALVSFDAYATKCLTSCDPTGCPNLTRLSLDLCSVASLDLSQNPQLQVLNIEDTRISSIDLSKNPLLTQLYASHESGSVNTDVKLSELDLTHNPDLSILTAAGNKLTSIDLSQNTALGHILLNNNYLTSIDLSANTALYNVYLSKNCMGFSTLPMPGQYSDYTYAQRPIEVERCYKVGDVIDFSGKVLREGTTTEAALYLSDTAAGTTSLLSSDYYTYADGKITLLKAVTDSVSVYFANAAFPEADLQSSRFMVKSEEEFGKPSAIMSFNTSLQEGANIVFSVGIDGATATSPKEFFVDPGDGGQIKFTATTSDTPATPNVSISRSGYSAVTIYIPEGNILTAFASDGVSMTSVSLTNATELRELKIANAGLYSIDTKMNRCLRALDLSGNHLYSITLEGANGGYNKNVLSKINLSGNDLRTVTLNEHISITDLDMSDNKLTEFSFKDMDNMQRIDVSNNLFESIDLNYLTQAVEIDVSSNKLTELVLPESPVLTSLNISDNNFTFAQIPYLPSVTDYTYAPQAQLVIPSIGPGIDLSAQNRVIDGVSTVFTWRNTNGEAVPQSDITCEGGLSKFVNPDYGTVYCEMTHPKFPGFSGNSAYRTTPIQTAPMPTNVIASFTTTENGETASLSFAAAKEGSAIFIDWTDEGKTLDQYILGTTYRLFSATTTAGATVKVYSYDETSDVTVFSITGVSMGSVDISGLPQLTTLTLSGAGLSEINIPANAPLGELYLDNNKLQTFDPSKYPLVYSLSLAGNQLTSIDLSKNTRLAQLSVANNNLTEINLGQQPNLWAFYASDNALETIDLSGASALEEIYLSNNLLKTIDVENKRNLRVLDLGGNLFTFSTLPLPKTQYTIYAYLNQPDMEIAEDAEGNIDLSSQAMAGTTPTEYRWFLGEAEWDENGELVGEELIEGTEYTVTDGVTKFLKPFDEVMCVMSNEIFPNLYICTNLIKVEAGVKAVAVDAGFVVTVNGCDITVNTSSDLPVAIYSIDGRCLGSKIPSGGQAQFTSSTAGVYIVNQGAKSVKAVTF